MTTVMDHIDEAPIRTPDQRLRVFVSSTIGELAAERAAVKTAIRTLRLSPVMFELGARPHPPRQLYRSYLAQSQVFIGIYWQSYGWVAPDEDVSGIEDEYRLAGGRPALIYVKEPANERDPRLEEMLDRIRSDDRVSYRKFESPGELAELVVDDLAVLLSERFELDRPLPSGTLTFLTSDIAGSEQLADRLGDRYAPFLETHRREMERLITAGGGHLVDADRDTTFSVFPDAIEAARTAVAARRTVLELQQVDLRLGLHTGTVTPSGGVYAGIEVHRAGRIGAAAEGGQILLSVTTAELLGTSRSEGWEIHDLGRYSLPGLDRTEHLYTLAVGGEPAGSPRARRVRSSRLPTPLTKLVGREDDIQAVAGMLATPDVRLVTLTGPGGIGKTRLGLAVAEQVMDLYPDGAFFVDLAPVAQPGDVLAAVAEAAGVAAEGDPLDALAEALSHRRALIVADNFEHVVDAAGELKDLLARAPGLNVLVTSRVVLRISGEHEYPVEPLGLPQPGSLTPETMAGAKAVELFVDRTVAVVPGFRLDQDNAAAIAEICRLLDGVPLAIEIAAARLRMLSPASLAERLRRSIYAVGQGPSDLPGRQRTLRATLDWSHDLLTAEEQRAFRRLGVFAGSWSLEAAEAVIDDPDVDDVADIVGSLLDKSLVRREPGDDPRFRMLVTVREYSAEQLAASGEEDEIRARHAAFFADLAAASSESLIGPFQASTVARLGADWANIEAAAEWFLLRGDCDSLVSLIHDIWVFFWLGDHVARGEEWLERACGDHTALDPVQAGKLHWIKGSGAYERGDYVTARQLIALSVEQLEGGSDARALAWARYLESLIMPAFSEPAEEVKEAIAHAAEAFSQAGDRWGEGYALMTLGILAASEGDLQVALSYHQHARALAETLRNDNLIGQVEIQLGVTAMAGGDLTAAGKHLQQAVDLFSRRNYREGMAYTFEAAAALHFQSGCTDLGMLALGAAEEIRRRLDLHPWPATAWFFAMLIGMADSVDDPEVQAWRRLGAETDPFDLAPRVLGPTAVCGAA